MRLLVSLALGAFVGVCIGLVLGWGVFPVESVDNPATALSQNYKDEYTVMIAAGYRADGDAIGAIERLSILGEENIPLYVQQTAERFIANSRTLTDIEHVVALARGLGVLTPAMEPFLEPASNTP
jgi:hypothetical protein